MINRPHLRLPLLALSGCFLAMFTTLAFSADQDVASFKKIQEFVKSQQANLSKNFPYRINLPKNGQVAKNQAGVRIAENASQLLSDNVGQVFYYDLYDHAMRVPHWHANATEAGVVLEGKMRITIWEGKGKSKVFTVEKNGTWTIPAASLHVLENIGPTNLKFLVDYDVPNSADRDFVTAWAALPDAILERAVGLTREEISAIPKTTQQRLQLSEFDPKAQIENESISSPFSNNFSKVKPLYESKLGSIRRIDGENTPAMKTLSLQQTVMKSGTLRTPHWYVGADDLLYIYKGTAFLTMMNDDGTVYNAMLNPGDLVFIPKGAFHTLLNASEDNLEFYETFNTAKSFPEINLLNGAQHFNTSTMAAAIGISKNTVEKVMNEKSNDYMMAF